MAKKHPEYSPYSKIARNPLWVLVVDVKNITPQTCSIVRVFKHAPSGIGAVYAMHNADADKHHTKQKPAAEKLLTAPLEELVATITAATEAAGVAAAVANEAIERLSA